MSAPITIRINTGRRCIVNIRRNFDNEGNSFVLKTTINISNGYKSDKLGKLLRDTNRRLNESFNSLNSEDKEIVKNLLRKQNSNYLSN